MGESVVCAMTLSRKIDIWRFSVKLGTDFTTAWMCSRLLGEVCVASSQTIAYEI